MPCDRDEDAVRRRLVDYLEKAALDLLAEYGREQHHSLAEYRARELVRQWLAERPASTTKRGGQQ